MKKIILLNTLFFIGLIVNAQDIFDMNVSPTADTSLVDVNLHTGTSTISEFISEEQFFSSNIITMNICYYVTGFQVTTQYNDTFPVTVPADSDYTLVVNLYRSQTQGVCDYTELTDTATLEFTTPLTETVYLSVEDFELLQNQIKVYPNPVKDILFLDIPNNLILKNIIAYNILGKEIKTFTIGLESLDVRDLNNGIYLLKLNTDKGIITKKIIISN